MKLFFFPLFKIAKDACNQATAITGITPAFVEWGTKYAGRKCSKRDQYFPLGYSQNKPETTELNKAKIFWQSQGIDPENNQFIICFFGTFGRQVNLKTVIEAALQLEKCQSSVLFVLCGTGDKVDDYRKLAQNCSNIIFPGWIDQAEIWTLMRISSLGIAPYYSSLDFSMSIPNKVIEYLSAGLPILSSLEGTVKNLLTTYSCGISYNHQNSEELVKSIIQLKEFPEYLKKMARNAKSLYCDKFVAEKVYSDMINYLLSFTKND